MRLFDQDLRKKATGYPPGLFIAVYWKRMARSDLRPPRAAGVAVLGDGIGLIGAQNIVGEATEPSEDARVFSDAAGVFAQRDIACVMRRVLDPPMLANCICSHLCGDRAV